MKGKIWIYNRFNQTLITDGEIKKLDDTHKGIVIEGEFYKINGL
jgi:hypothetical protein